MPASVVWPELKVPTPSPGSKVPPVLMARVPRTPPLPFRVAPLATVVAVAEETQSICRVPSVTIVVPVLLMPPLRIWVPVPVLTSDI